MNDLVFRDGIIEQFREEFGCSIDCHECNLTSSDCYAAQIVLHAPAIDAVAVVRCKDCKYAEPNDASDDYKDCRNLFGMAVKNDWFCGDGERREENEAG